MQIAIKNKTPKIISGIVCTISLIAAGWFFLPPFWFWVSLEILAAALVAIGCTGEWWLHHHPAGRKKKAKDEHHQLEARFIAMVAIGVIIEFFALGHSIKEGKQLENEVESGKILVAAIGTTNQWLIASNNLVSLQVEDLRRVNSELEMSILPRWIMNTKDLSGQLSKYAGTKFMVIVDPNPSNSDGPYLASQIVSLLKGSKWELVPNESNLAKSYFEHITDDNGINFFPGVAVNARVGIDMPEAAQALVTELNKGQIIANRHPNRNHPPDVIVIKVGSNPSFFGTQMEALDAKLESAFMASVTNLQQHDEREETILKTQQQIKELINKYSQQYLKN